MDTLHEHEKIILQALEKGALTEAELVKATGLQQASVSHASLWLYSKGLTKIDEAVTEWVELNDEGRKYLKEGLPERKALKLLAKSDVSAKDLGDKIGPAESRIAMAWLMKSRLARVEKGVIKLTEEGERALNSKLPAEEALEALNKKVESSKAPVGILGKRGKIFRVSENKVRTVMLTDKGRKLVDKGIEIGNEVNVLTPQLIKSGKWKDTKFRAYDITGVAPPMLIGKRQPYKALLDEARDRLTSMGFIEMRGPVVETEFWNFDTLYQPQNHPTRSRKDTYYILKPNRGELPTDHTIKVRQAHESGFAEGSRGWGYQWNPEKAKELIMRTHTTAVSAHAMAEHGDKKGKYFTISRNFRRDVIDATHLPEFYQCDGIIVDPDMNFRQLLGMLKDFAREFAYTEEVRFRADYFPYTEPSVELSAKHPDLGWIELGGAGMFRPEVREPLGIKSEVMAWGLGFDRLVMLKLGIKDIRQLFSTDLKWLGDVSLRYEMK